MDGQNFQNNPYQQPVPPNEPKKTDTMSIVALIVGIASIVTSCRYAYLSIPLGIGGIVCSIMANKKQKSGLAIAGLVCSIIGLVLTVLLLIIGALAVAMLASQGLDINDLLNY